MMPAYAKNLIARRNQRQKIGDVFVSIGWPSDWLKSLVESSPFAKNAHILGTPDPLKKYEFGCVCGLSVCVWCDQPDHKKRGLELIRQIILYNPLRLFLLDVVTGHTQFFVCADSKKIGVAA
jgi:hypothetical protein